MADSLSSSSSENPSGPKRGQEFWALVALGTAALICVTLLAVALALILGHSSSSAVAPPPITISNIGNSGAPSAAVAPAPATAAGGIHRPYEPAKPQSERQSAMDRSQPALPGLLASPTPPGGERKLALTRADPPSPPSPSPMPTADAHKVFFRVRADPASLYQGQKALPMPIRYSPDAQGRVSQVFATKDAADDAERFSTVADVPFADSGIHGQALDLQLSQPRKTSSVDGFRSPKGFQFFTAKLSMSNQSAQPLSLKVDDLEVHDEDGVRYLVNPELVFGSWPDPTLDAGASTQVELSFLVPEGAPLKEMAVQEAPGRVVLVPLQAR